MAVEAENQTGRPATGEPAGLEPARPLAHLSLEERIDAEATQMLFGMGRSGSLTMFGVVLIASAIMFDFGPVWAPAAVFANQLLAQLLFSLIRRAYLTDPEASRRAPLWARRYALLCLLSGFTWGLGAILWMPGAPFEFQAFYCLIVGTLATGTVISRAAYPPAMWAYAGSIALPVAAVFAAIGTPLAFAGAALTLLYLYTVIQWNRQLNKSTRHTIALRFENDDLVARLSRAHEVALQKRQEAEAAHAAAHSAKGAKDEFLALLSHEIRTPLNNIVGMTELLDITGLDTKQTNYTRAIRDSAQLLNETFSGIVELAEMQARTLTLHPAKVSPAELIRATARDFRADATKAGLSIEADIAPGLPDHILVDETRLRQILRNLLENALSFTEKGGVILRVAPLNPNDPKSPLRFSVTDTGIGIKPEVKARLFQTFSQGEKIITRRRRGVGLGLATCDRLLDLMGGYISVDSEVGQGSTFWFVLPQEPSEPAVERDGAGDAGVAAMVDRDRLFALEQEMGTDATVSHLVSSLNRIVSALQATMAAHDRLDIAAVREQVSLIEAISAEAGLSALCASAAALEAALKNPAEQSLPGKAFTSLQEAMTQSYGELARTYPQLAR